MLHRVQSQLQVQPPPVDTHIDERRDYDLRRLLFGIAVTVALVAWANATAGVVHISTVDSLLPGFALALVGVMCLLPRAAQLLPHPIETGFSITCIGVSIATGSTSGLWLVSPAVALACAAYTAGYKRYIPRPRSEAHPVRLLPDDTAATPTAGDYLRFFLFMVLPWLVLYEAILAIGIPPDAINGVSHFEQSLPVLEWTQVFYGSVYLMVLSVPFFAKTRRDLRWFSVRGLWTMLLAYPAFLAIPLIAPKRVFVPHSVPGHLLVLEQALDSPVAAFPSFHVIWVLLAAEVYSRHWPRLKWFFYGWAILVSASCVTTGQHSVLDVVGGVATVVLVSQAPRVWSVMACHVERITRHRAYAGMGVFVALWVAGTAAGPLTGINPWLAAAALSIGIACIRVAVPRYSPGYPAPIYFLIWNVLTVVMLARLWMLAVPLHLITGIFLILASLGIFVEGAQRAWNPRLNPHQRTAIAIGIGGVLVTALGESMPAPAPLFSWDPLLPAIIVALIAGVAWQRISIWRSA